jgi:hypothetical protein
MYKGPFHEILRISDSRDHAKGMISDITVDLVALIKNLYEYPEYLRVVSSQLFYNRVLHKGSWRGRIIWAPKGDQVFQLYWSSLLVACPRDTFSGS